MVEKPIADSRKLDLGQRNLGFEPFRPGFADKKAIICVSINPLPIPCFILLHEEFLQFDWLRAVIFQLNLKYLHVKITNLLRVVV